jgi:hypothetical protein
MRATLVLVSLLLLAPACRRFATPANDSTAAPGTFGATCSKDSECQSKACFIGGSNAYCSMACKQETAATDCPKPLTSGACNKHGYCKKP